MSELEPAPTESTPTLSPMQRATRQLSRRTTDLVAIAIVAIGVLTISGQLRDWWLTDPSDVMSTVESATNVAGTQVNWGSGDSAVRLAAGDFPVELERRIERGSQDEIEERLSVRCQQILQATTSDSLQAVESMHAIQRKLMKQLADLQPLTSSPGQWSVYRVDQPGSYLPGCVLIGIRTVPDDAGKTEPFIACWAIAIPHDEDQWTTFLFTPTSGQASSSPVRLPVDAEPVLSLRTPAGDELSVFRSREGAAVNATIWRRSIEDSLTRTGWQTVRPWRQSGSAWTIRVEGEFDSARPRSAAIELSLRETPDGRLSGIVNVIQKQSRQD